MTHAEIRRLFRMAHRHVSMEAHERHRAFAWQSRMKLEELGRLDEWPNARWDWLMSDPEWREAIFLARLGGGK